MFYSQKRNEKELTFLVGSFFAFIIQKICAHKNPMKKAYCYCAETAYKRMRE